MTSIHNHNTPNTSPLGATNPSNGSHPVSKDAMFHAMVALLEELKTLSTAQVSVADLSTALYDHMVPNATNRLKDLQHKLSNYQYMLEHYSEFQKYWTQNPPGPKPPLAPGMTDADLADMKQFFLNHNDISSLRMGVASVAQTLSAQNTYVEDTQTLAQGIQSQVGNLADAKMQVSSQIPAYLALMQVPFMQRW